MSRIGKLPIEIPKGVKIDFNQSILTVKGPKGQLTQKIEEGFTFENEGATFKVLRPTDQKRHKSLHGLYRSLIRNMTAGVSDGFQTTLELVGVGYRAEVKGAGLELSLGFSHSILFILPGEVEATVDIQKGQNVKIILRCIDKQLLGQVVAKIKSIRPPEPYKGKGVRLLGEAIRRKAGKSSGKKK